MFRKLPLLAFTAALVLGLPSGALPGDAASTDREEKGAASPAGVELSGKDLLQIAPEDLRGPDPQEFLAAALKAYTEKRYEDAVRSFVEVIRRDPSDFVSLYNLACCYALMGAEAQAARFLKASWDAGFKDLEHIEQDHDFDGVRESKPFQAVLAEFQSELAVLVKQAGRRVDVVVPTVQSARVLEPEGLEAGRKVPLVLALHGAGDNSDRYVRHFAEKAAEHGMILCLPEAPYAIATNIPGGVGYLWYRFLSDGPEALSVNLSDQYILAVIDSVLAHTPAADPERVFITGFSQGGFLAYTLALRHPDRFHGVVAIGAGADPRDLTEKGATNGWPGFFICHSPEDRVIPWEIYEASADFLRKKGLAFDSYRYEGGHTVTPALTDTIFSWMEQKAREPRERRMVPLPEGVRVD